MKTLGAPSSSLSSWSLAQSSIVVGFAGSLGSHLGGRKSRSSVAALKQSKGVLQPLSLAALQVGHWHRLRPVCVAG